MKENPNKQNDELSSKERSEVNRHLKRKSHVKEVLTNKENKQKLMDFIFGKSEENPLA